jgi:hypothetical protein
MCVYDAARCCGKFCTLPECGCNTAEGCDGVSAPCPKHDPDPSPFAPSGPTCTDCTTDDNDSDPRGAGVCCVPDHVPLDSADCVRGAWVAAFCLLICWPCALAFVCGCCPRKPPASTASASASASSCCHTCVPLRWGVDRNLGFCGFVSFVLALGVVLLREIHELEALD